MDIVLDLIVLRISIARRNVLSLPLLPQLPLLRDKKQLTKKRISLEQTHSRDREQQFHDSSCLLSQHLLRI